jgi:hypothetical protein
MNSEEIKHRVKEIGESIKLLQDELIKIKSECIHKDYHVGFYSWRAGVMDVVKICDYCSENIGPPSKKEVDEFLKEEKK